MTDSENRPKTKRRISGPRKFSNHIAFTTGEVAMICDVAPRTVSKWCDNGKLPFYKLPLSSDRRIVHKDLLAFMIENNIPLDNYPSDLSTSFLFVLSNISIKAERDSLFVGKPENKIVAYDASSVAEAGYLFSFHRPSIVFIDYQSTGRIDFSSLIRLIRMTPGPSPVVVVAVVGLHDDLSGFDFDFAVPWNSQFGQPLVDDCVARLNFKRKNFNGQCSHS